MDFSSSFKKSFKSHSSYKHSRKISASGGDDVYHEEQPILSDHRDNNLTMKTVDPIYDPEVIVKIDGRDHGIWDVDQSGMGPDANARQIWRESSYEFWTDERGGNTNNAGDRCYFPQRNEATTEDPPSKLIGQFLNKQRAAGGEMLLDMDLEMDELHHDNSHNLPTVAESPIDKNNNNNQISSSKELKVSFQAPPTSVVDIKAEHVETRYEVSSDDDDYGKETPPQKHNRWRSSNMAPAVDNSGGGEVLRCTSFQRRQSIFRTKTKSRLIDLPEKTDRRSEKMGKSGPLKSGMLGRASGMLGKPTDDEEEDPLFDEDIPEEYKRANLSAITLLQWVSLILIVPALVCSLAIHKLKERKLWGLPFWKWDVLVLVLICGRLVSGWGIRFVVFFIERNFLLRKRVLYFVYGVRKAVQNCIWLGLVLISWHFLFDRKVERETNSKFLKYVNKVLLCLLVGTLLWLVKTLMVKVLASSFHVSTFFDRIQESLFNQYMIETLSGPPLIELLNTQEEVERTMAEVWKLQNAGATVPPDLTATAFPSTKSGRVKGLQKTSRVVSIKHGVLSTLDEQILDSTTDDESTTQIRSEFEAKLAARKIFRNVARHLCKYICLEDLMRFMQEDEALKTMSLLGGSTESEKISKAALKNWVVNAFRERRALALTLNDTKTAVNKLHQMVNVLVGIIIVIISLLILGIATSKFLLFVSSQVVVVAFVFGNTCKTVFEAIVFLFVMHPFDVGDRCEIDGVQMIVEEMNILTTVFLRYDNQKIIFPNSTLSTKAISNYYRSPDMGDSVDFHVHIATPAEKISIMKQRITNYIESKKDHWYSSPTVVLMNLEELNKLKMSVWMRHRMNHQDMGEKWLRRALVIEEMVKIFKELDIEYRLLPLDINIRSMPLMNSTRLPSTWTASNK
ncbi:hypothetical protein F0562_020966 [Nyssa sinensis]|uniref:Mechanosensitive ion channel protein n=1 Tax=Nyssa sinensis TaxID=561372 RepID=A0A5J5BVQ5_9ASTE|nr:hypothetical protein F0562_020966 [Nyssa sinensis]